MSKSAKNAAAKAKSAEGLTFEEALDKLEAIAEAMESDELPLEQMLRQYEEGSRLVQFCAGKLKDAEAKIQKLEQDGAGEYSLKPVDMNDGSKIPE